MRHSPTPGGTPFVPRPPHGKTGPQSARTHPPPCICIRKHLLPTGCRPYSLQNLLTMMTIQTL